MPSDPFAKWRLAPIKEEASKSSRGLGMSALRQVGRLGRAAATGISGLADIPNLASLGLHAAGLKEDPMFYEPIAGKVQRGIDTLTGGVLTPENKTEEYMDMIGEGLAPIALAPLTGGASLTGMAARGLAKHGAGKAAQKLAHIGSTAYKPTAANIAGSIGSSAALKAYLDEGGDPNILGSLLASMAGGAGARGALKLKNPLNAAAEGIGAATGFSPEKYAKNIELGLPVTPANVSRGKLPGYLEMGLAKIPGSMGPLEDFSKSRESAIARNLGIRTPEDLEHAITALPKHLARKGGKGYKDRIESIVEKRNQKFKPRENQAIANQETVDVSDIIGGYERRREKRISESSKKRWDKTADGILLKELKEDIIKSPGHEGMAQNIKSLRAQGYPEDMINKAMDFYIKEIPHEKMGIGLEDLNDLRLKALKESEKFITPSGKPTTESGEASQRHRLLSAKRHQFMEEIGNPTEVHNSKEMRKLYARYKNKIDGMEEYVIKLTRSKNEAEAFNKLTSTDPKYLRVARQGLDKKDRAKLTEGIIADLGDRQGRFNINTAHTGFSKLEEPVKHEFLRTLPSKGAQHNFKETMKFIGDHKRMMEQLANTSNTAHHNNLWKIVTTYGSAAGAAVMGHITPIILLSLAHLSTYGGTKLWTNQNFLKRMNDVISAKTMAGKTSKLDLLINSAEQLGRQSKHLQEEK